MDASRPRGFRRRLGLLLAALSVVAGCGGGQAAGPTLFEQVPETTSGVTFRNDLAEDPAFNILNYLYFYDGGGVAAGDVNNDGLVDLYFTANLLPNRLYLNRGNMRFEDVTDRAGVAGAAGWTKGVTMADVNGDGWLDLYVSTVTYLGKAGRNALYLNNGDAGSGPGQAPTFSERAAAVGLDHQGFSTQAAFFDYDRDGDLDAYLLNHSVHTEDTYGPDTLRYERHAAAGDKLYRNDLVETGTLRFTDVSAEAGIYGGRIGYGLGVVASDLDGDGCPDLFVSNDFHEHDYLYFNHCDGTFREAIRQAMPHTSRASMGNDAADFNNDGRTDVVVLDMMPEREDILRTSAGAETYEIYQLKRRFGYHHQVARNTLHLNRGLRRFSDVGFLAGVYATDWSWAALLADLDNDGLKDLFVTNGIYHRPNDLDFIAYVSTPAMQAALARGLSQDELSAALARMPQVPLPNYAFRNLGDLTFSNEAAAWGLDQPGFSNGAAYADLDNDGDLDLVVNNVNAVASIYENRADRLTGRHFLTVALRGGGANTAGLGARVMLRHRGGLQVQEQAPTRGWQSSVDPRLHFGLGDLEAVDTLVVVWPDGRFQTLTDVAADRVVTLRQDDAGGVYRYPPLVPADPLFEDATDALALGYRHRENTFIDFNRERLMPHKLSTEGPALAVGDVDGDGLEDLFAGGAKWQAARLLLQQPDGRFRPVGEALWQADSLYEDVDAAFFDADGDGDLDLYVVSGGNEFWGNADALADRLYLGDGRGGFTRADDALPGLRANGACVVPGDFDGDGDVDLFVGSRVVARAYGTTPPSFLLENDGTGRFADVTEALAPALADAGMVTDGAWTDLDGDGRLDLVVVGEWMPIRVFVQREGGFAERTAEAGFAGTEGWWSAVWAEDFDGDGDADLVAGNLGLNAFLQASRDEPVRLYVKDFDGNGSLDQILSYARGGVRYPLASRDDLIQQIPSLARTFETYAAYGAARLDDLFPAEAWEDVVVREAYVFASSYAENRGDGTFALRALPVEAQFAPVRAFLPGDFDGDGRLDLILAGNFLGAAPLLGPYDAGYGLLLRGSAGGFEAVDPATSNLMVEGDVRGLRRLRLADGTPLVLAARNDDRLQVLRQRLPHAALRRLPSPTLPDADL